MKLYPIYILNGSDCGSGKYYIELHVEGVGVLKEVCLLRNLPRALARHDLVMGELVRTSEGLKIIDHLSISRLP